MKKLIIFDMDGTLLDTSKDIFCSINFALTKFGYPVRTIEEIKKFSGDGLYKHLQRSLPKNCDNETIDRVFKFFFEYYKIHCEDYTAPYYGITELLFALKKLGYNTAIVSNKENSALQKLSEKFFLGLIDYAVGAKQGQKPKPSAEPIFDVLNHFGLQTSDVIYIGDTEVDYQTAINAKVDVISALWGFRDRDFLENIGAKTFAYTPLDVLNLL